MDNTRVTVCKIQRYNSGFSLGRLHMGGFIWGGGQSVNGGTHEGGHKPYGGTLLLLLSCNYTMQFVGYDSIKTH